MNNILNQVNRYAGTVTRVFKVVQLLHATFQTFHLELLRIFAAENPPATPNE